MESDLQPVSRAEFTVTNLNAKEEQSGNVGIHVLRDDGVRSIDNTNNNVIQVLPIEGNSQSMLTASTIASEMSSSAPERSFNSSYIPDNPYLMETQRG